MGRIPGTGLGLWEARTVAIDAHGGEIGVNCEPTTIMRSQGLAYHVYFTVKVPLRQKRATNNTLTPDPSPWEGEGRKARKRMPTQPAQALALRRRL